MRRDLGLRVGLGMAGLVLGCTVAGTDPVVPESVGSERAPDTSEPAPAQAPFDDDATDEPPPEPEPVVRRTLLDTAIPELSRPLSAAERLQALRALLDDQALRRPIDTPTRFSRRPAAAFDPVQNEGEVERVARLREMTKRDDPDRVEITVREASLLNERRDYYARFAGDAEARAKAAQASKRVVEILAPLLRDHRLASRKNLDVALHWFAVHAGFTGHGDRMREAYMRLIREYPTSEHVPAAYLAFGHHYFDEGNLPSAAKLYDKVASSFPKNRVAPIAQYRRAWCALLGARAGEAEWRDALEHFVQVIKVTSHRVSNEAWPHAPHLLRAARRDVVEAYLEAGRPARAAAFFDRIGSGPTREYDQAREMKESLASEYFVAKQYAESIHIYRELQRAYPEPAQVCRWQWAVVMSALAHDAELAAREIEKLHEAHRGLESAEVPAEARERCGVLYRDAARIILEPAP
ncbi:MAG: hypothetical protein AAF721_01555 [Myxococcota bacterium]